MKNLAQVVLLSFCLVFENGLSAMAAVETSAVRSGLPVVRPAAQQLAGGCPGLYCYVRFKPNGRAQLVVVT